MKSERKTSIGYKCINMESENGPDEPSRAKLVDTSGRQGWGKLVALTYTRPRVKQTVRGSC